jgi:eukaryotic-like serine/threonine-protein kinase
MANQAAPYHAGAAPSHVATLRQTLEQRGRLELDEAVSILVPVCVDLKERHARGEELFVHASTILVGGPGASRVEPSLMTQLDNAKDRAALAPEILASQRPGGSRASVFSIGAILYEMVTGAQAGPGMKRPKDLVPTLPSGLELLLSKALVSDPGRRPDDLGALAAAMHHMAPMRSLPPPDADVSLLDRGADFEVDIRLSMLPPTEAPASAQIPRAPAMPTAASHGDPFGQVVDRTSTPRSVDATTQLAQLKARLEADPSPRWVVNKDKMDHGPFSAVELLQQIASHSFLPEHTLRDDLTGTSKLIQEWEEFAPFADHARMGKMRKIEQKEVKQLERQEMKSGVLKYVVGAVIALSIASGLLVWLLQARGSKDRQAEMVDDPSAMDMAIDGGLASRKKPGGGGGGAGGGKGAGGGGGQVFAYGMSYEAAMGSYNEQITMGQASGPDLTRGQLGAPLQNARFISGCGAPDDMHVTVRVAVRMGRAVGVTVSTNPPNGSVAKCIDSHVRALSWPANPKMDFVTTNY